jgi:hypothetical protein
LRVSQNKSKEDKKEDIRDDDHTAALLMKPHMHRGGKKQIINTNGRMLTNTSSCIDGNSSLRNHESPPTLSRQGEIIPGLKKVLPEFLLQTACQ